MGVQFSSSSSRSDDDDASPFDESQTVTIPQCLNREEDEEEEREEKGSIGTLVVTDTVTSFRAGKGFCFSFGSWRQAVWE